jgi:DNA-binding beta-propeller fold protein YncE
MRAIRARISLRTALPLLAAIALGVFAVTWSPPSSSSASAPEALLVADLRGQALLVVDPTDPAAARRIALAGGPHELLRLPDDRVLVSLEQSGALALVDVNSGSVELIEVGGLPHGLALDGDTVLVTDRSVHAVRRFDLGLLSAHSWSELEPIASGWWPHAVAVTPAGEVAVTSAEPGTVSLGASEVLVGLTTETLAVRGDGAMAAAAATDGVVVLLAPDGTLLQRWDVGGRPVRVAFSPDGGTLAVALSAAHELALIEGDRVRRVPVEGVPDGLAFSSDGRLVYASDVFGGAITAIDVPSGAVRAVLRVGESTGALLVATR